MINLDLKDRKILYELDLNCRQSDSEIAKKVGLSRDSVRYRIKKLKEKGVINYFMTALNSMKLGYDWYRILVKFQNLSLEKEKEIVEWLKKRVSWMTRVEGIWDLNTGTFCQSNYEFRDFLHEFLRKYNHFIERHEVAVVTRMWHYNRDYLLNREVKTSSPFLMGFEKKEEYTVEKIDQIDYKILQILLRNARMKTIDIARKINSTEMVVRYRIKRLIKSGVIIGFRAFLDINKLGYSHFKIHFTLHNYSPEQKKQIFEYIHQNPKTFQTTELIGGDDLEVESQVKSNKELYEHISDIRRKFGEIIKDYEFMQYTEEFKFTYLPEMY